MVQAEANRECGVGQKFVLAQAPYVRRADGVLVTSYACRFSSRDTRKLCPWRARTLCAVGQTCLYQVADGLAHNDHSTYTGSRALGPQLEVAITPTKAAMRPEELRHWARDSGRLDSQMEAALETEKGQNALKRMQFKACLGEKHTR